MRVTLTPDDLKKGDLVEPGWYPIEIAGYSEEVTKDKTEGGKVIKKSDGSVNAIFVFKICDGQNKGVEVKKYYNEKALGFGKNLWAALEFPFDKEKGYDLSTELFRQSVGSKLEAYFKRGTSDKGNDFNDIADFRPLR